MKKIFNVPTIEQLSKLSQIIKDEFSDIKKENMSIVFELDEELLKQVDEDYFYKINPSATSNDFQPGSEVNVNVNDMKFKFIKKINDNEENTK